MLKLGNHGDITRSARLFGPGALVGAMASSGRSAW